MTITVGYNYIYNTLTNLTSFLGLSEDGGYPDYIVFIGTKMINHRMNWDMFPILRLPQLF